MDISSIQSQDDINRDARIIEQAEEQEDKPKEEKHKEEKPKEEKSIEKPVEQKPKSDELEDFMEPSEKPSGTQ